MKRSNSFLIVLVAVAGCGSPARHGGVGGNGAMAGARDGVARQVVGGDNGGFADRIVGTLGGDCRPTRAAATAQLVVDTMAMPRSRTDFAFDLVGSGTPVNRLGDLVAALAQPGWNAQASVDSSLRSGQTVLLLAETSADPMLTNDACAAVRVEAGAPVTFPPTRGAHYSPAGAPGDFAGPLVDGEFSSAAPATTEKPVTLAVSLPLFAAVAPLPLHIVGAHVRLSNGIEGQLNGAIPEHDVDAVVLPALAQTMEAHIMADQGNLTQTDMQILSIFDTGGPASAIPAMGCAASSCTQSCQNPSVAAAHACACARANDGYVDECEVASNSIVQDLVAPDVQMFAADGSYKPSPDGTTKDSLSIGFGFTAISAHF